jgi:hypothetical protein
VRGQGSQRIFDRLIDLWCAGDGTIDDQYEQQRGGFEALRKAMDEEGVFIETR